MIGKPDNRVSALLSTLLLPWATPALLGQGSQEAGGIADASHATFPAQRAAGSLHGHPFTLGAAHIKPFHEWSGTVGDPPSKQSNVDGSILSLEAASGRPAQNAFTVFLAVKPGDRVDGKTFVVPAGGMFKQTTKIMDRDGKGWFLPVAGVQARSLVAGERPKLDPMPLCSMRLTFGHRHNGRLPGKIYLALKDADKSYVAGTFDAMIEEK